MINCGLEKRDTLCLLRGNRKVMLDVIRVHDVKMNQFIEPLIKKTAKYLQTVEPQPLINGVSQKFLDISKNFDYVHDHLVATKDVIALSSRVRIGSENSFIIWVYKDGKIDVLGKTTQANRSYWQTQVNLSSKVNINAEQSADIFDAVLGKIRELKQNEDRHRI